MTSAIIGNGVTNIGYAAFRFCSRLTSVAIGNSVTSIGCEAFSHCTSLKNVIIPDSVTSIDYSAFCQCTSLISVTIGNGVTSINNGAFLGCYKLVEVINHSKLTITKGSNSYGDIACHALEVHTEESKIVNMADYLFYTCDGINYLCDYVGTDTMLILPADYNGETYKINQYAFINLHKLHSITIPDSVTSIGNHAFADCSSLSSITIPNSVTSIGSSAFSHCTNLKNITIPDSVTSINSYAFSGCTKLTNVTFQEDNGCWYAGDLLVSYETVSNPTTAAQHLTTLYYNKDWTRSTHTYSSSYTTYNDQQHQQICTTCNKPKYTNHVWDEGTITKISTHLENGTKEYSCTVCSETQIEILDKLPDHTYTYDRNDVDSHITKCECGFLAYELHSWDSGVTIPATHTAEGSTTYTCTDCGEVKTEVLPTLPAHTFGDWQTYNEEQHMRVCECGFIDYVDHTWDIGVIVPGTDGTTYSCIVCGTTKTESSPAYTAGDVNGDGVISNKDLIRMTKYMAGIDVEVMESALDVNGDGVFNAKDQVRLKKILAQAG